LLGRNGKPDNIATTVTEVSERVTLLIREEIELARAEVQQKVRTLSRGLIGGAIGAVFVLLFIPFLLLTIAWGINSATGSIWIGFLVVTLLLLIGAAIAFYFAYRKFQVGAPAPQMALQEAQRIRDTVAAAAGGEALPAGTNGGGGVVAPAAAGGVAASAVGGGVAASAVGGGVAAPAVGGTPPASGEAPTAPLTGGGDAPAAGEEPPTDGPVVAPPTNPDGA
jgi:hypothetical protein